jgi:RNA polymerase sigma-70 factor (ECF subfamily)
MTASVSLEFTTLARLADREPDDAEETALESAQTLDRFLASVERRAFRVAQMAVRDRDDALDIVQGAMLRLAQNYARRPSEEWKPLFYRILYNGIRDFQRRRSVRSRIFGMLPGQWADDEEVQADPFERVASDAPEPSRQLMADEAMQRLEVAVAQLPDRQQQAFALRCLEGMDVAETAAAMGCSEGSVKTHYFRALQTLRAKLGEVW